MKLDFLDIVFSFKKLNEFYELFVIITIDFVSKKKKIIKIKIQVNEYEYEY